MLSFLDDVDGYALLMKNLHSTVSFPTESDVMFASFFTKYATTALAIFDDFMSFLRHLNFRAEDLVIKNINELPDYISKQRPIVAERRTCVSRTAGPPATRSSNNSIVSTLVVGSLAECIASERTPSKFVVAEKLNFRR